MVDVPVLVLWILLGELVDDVHQLVHGQWFVTIQELLQSDVVNVCQSGQMNS